MDTLTLQAYGINIYIKIDGYGDKYDWCSCKLKVDGAFISYWAENDEMIQSCEIDWIAKQLKKLIAGKMKKQKSFDILENYMSFCLHPATQTDDISVDLIFNFWYDCKESLHAYSNSRMILDLDRYNIECLLKYLKAVKACAKYRASN